MTTPPDRPGDPLDPSRVSPCPILRDELLNSALLALKLHGLVAHWGELPETELPWDTETDRVGSKLNAGVADLNVD